MLQVVSLLTKSKFPASLFTTTSYYTILCFNCLKKSLFMVTENSLKTVVKQGVPNNLISILVLLYCTNYVSKKGVLINNTDHIINTTFIK